MAASSGMLQPIPGLVTSCVSDKEKLRRRWVQQKDCVIAYCTKLVLRHRGGDLSCELPLSCSLFICLSVNECVCACVGEWVSE